LTGNFVLLNNNKILSEVGFGDIRGAMRGVMQDSMGLIIWSLLSRRLYVATTTKPNLGYLAPVSEVAGRHILPF
jgi:hypothetical protein